MEVFAWTLITLGALTTAVHLTWSHRRNASGLARSIHRAPVLLAAGLLPAPAHIAGDQPAAAGACGAV